MVNVSARDYTGGDRMAPRTATAERYIIDEPASLEETQQLFGMSDKRAATLAKWAAEALRAVEHAPAATRASKASPKRTSKRATKKKTSAKR